MKTTFWKNKLFLSLAVATTVAAPIAVVVACGSDESTPTPTPTDPAETAAQKSIIDAPATLPATATLPTRILFNLKGVITKYATAAKVTPAEYLAANKPVLNASTALDYIPVLTSEIKIAYGLAADTVFGSTEFVVLVGDLGIDVTKFAPAFEKAVKDYDGKKTDGAASWDALIKFWNYVLDPAPNGTYAHLKTLLKTDNVITEANLANVDKVMTATKGQPSGVKKADGTADILGFGGTKAIFTTPTTETPSTETPTTTTPTETKPTEPTTGTTTPGTTTPAEDPKTTEPTTGTTEPTTTTPAEEPKSTEPSTGTTTPASGTESSTPTTTTPAETSQPAA